MRPSIRFEPLKVLTFVLLAASLTPLSSALAQDRGGDHRGSGDNRRDHDGNDSGRDNRGNGGGDRGGWDRHEPGNRNDGPRPDRNHDQGRNDSNRPGPGGDRPGGWPNHDGGNGHDGRDNRDGRGGWPEHNDNNRPGPGGGRTDHNDGRDGHGGWPNHNDGRNDNNRPGPGGGWPNHNDGRDGHNGRDDHGGWNDHDHHDAHDWPNQPYYPPVVPPVYNPPPIVQPPPPPIETPSQWLSSVIFNGITRRTGGEWLRVSFTYPMTVSYIQTQVVSGALQIHEAYLLTQSGARIPINEMTNTGTLGLNQELVSNYLSDMGPAVAIDIRAEAMGSLADMTVSVWSEQGVPTIQALRP